MTWKIRHEGSPQHLETTLEQLRQAIADGLWEPTDEVMGPGDADWVPIESHPALADVAADLEPSGPRTCDETRLDMTPLIDVCLVLLVFFVLTASVAALQTRVEAPAIDKAGVRVLTQKQVQERMTRCTIQLVRGTPVIRVEGKVTDLWKLKKALGRHLDETGKGSLLLEVDGEVSHETVVRVIEAAKAAGMERVSLVVP